MEILNILLQNTPIETLLTKVGDQIFSISLLLTISWLLWKRITTVQNRMDSYLTEDRAKMADVINNNTKVMERVLDSLK